MAFDLIQHFRKFEFGSCRHVLVAVSGGSDSVGLLLALNSHLKSLPSGPSLSAVTVDHGLREGSAKEAADVAALCARLNIPHIIKQWQGAKPATGIQAAARHERRALLCQCATEIGADVIATGHTFDDQIETVVMRQRRGSGPGLAGIADASLGYDDRGDGGPVWIVRPLLDVTRCDIRNYLQAQQIAWVDDPSNDNQAYERIAVRNELLTASDEMRRDIFELSLSAASKRERLATHAGRLLNSHVREVAPGLVHIDPSLFATSESPVISVLLRTMIAFSGGAASLGDGQIADDIIQHVATFGFSKGAKPWRATSNRALIEIRQTGVYLLREGRKVVRGNIEYDGRYRATSAHRLVKPFDLIAPSADVPLSLLRKAHDQEPHYEADSVSNISAYEAARSGYALRRLLNPWPDLVPLFDLELAKNLSVLASTGAFPARPVYCHVKN
jgi:tRNA(Ile)-lysidine synthase